VNARLPADVRVFDRSPVSDSFHAEHRCAAHRTLRGEREKEGEWTWWAHTGGGNALAFKQPHDIQTSTVRHFCIRCTVAVCSAWAVATRCERRRYEYLVPYDALAIEEDGVCDRSQLPRLNQTTGRVSLFETTWHLAIQRRLKRVLKQFIGTWRMHNYLGCDGEGGDTASVAAAGEGAWLTTEFPPGAPSPAHTHADSHPRPRFAERGRS
jgi:tRNA U38,U39,U40 pseudouridine synthase TruA